MKHDDFLKALNSLKNQYTSKQPKQTIYPVNDEDGVSSHCICKDSRGESKYLYTSQTEIEYILSSTSVKLYSYPCPYEKGWHITKN